MRKFLAAATMLAITIATAGCTDGGPRLVTVKGTVTMANAPVAQANVGVYYPDNTSASGMTDAQGVFTLTYNGKPGAMPGTGLKVTVTKQTSAYGDMTGMDPSKMDPSMLIKKGQEMGGEKKGPTIPKQLLPAKFSDPAQSGLTIDIPAGGKEDIKIELSGT